MTSDEKLLLIELAEKFREKIQNKGSDVLSVSQRKAAWATPEDFNSHELTSTRSSQQLQKSWGYIQTRRRKQLTEKSGKEEAKEQARQEIKTLLLEKGLNK
ncbi:hypothetical protein FQR65_LT01023 [Abscondita terminalis]|nr:hypothetical protein FQR65_LT01023 [Abscondita terminalis]